MIIVSRLRTRAAAISPSVQHAACAELANIPKAAAAAKIPDLFIFVPHDPSLGIARSHAGIAQVLPIMVNEEPLGRRAVLGFKRQVGEIATPTVRDQRKSVLPLFSVDLWAGPHVNQTFRDATNRLRRPAV